MLLRAAIVFSWTLTIDGVSFDTFGNISISHSLSGYGTSGIVTSTMTVTTHDTTVSGNAVSNNAVVTLTCSDAAIVPPTYYVLSRKVDGNTTTWTCGDRMCKAECDVSFVDSDFDEDDKISCSSLITKTYAACGFTSVSLTGGSSSLPSIIGNIDRSHCESNTARSILDMLSAAMLGYWFADGNTLVFVPFGSAYRGTQVNQHTTVTPCGTKTLSRIILSDGDNVYTAGTGNSYQTLLVDTPLASQALAAAVLNNIPDNFVYTAWRCDKGKALGWIYLGSVIFPGSTRLCNSVTLYPSPAGLFFTASCNMVSEDEAAYISSVQRQLNKKIEMDRILKNAALTKDGIVFFENGYNGHKYQFNLSGTNGVVNEYDGAITCKVVPSEISVGNNADTVTYTLGGKQYVLGLTWDGDNISGMTRTEVE